MWLTFHCPLCYSTKKEKRSDEESTLFQGFTEKVLAIPGVVLWIADRNRARRVEDGFRAAHRTGKSRLGCDRFRLL